MLRELAEWDSFYVIAGSAAGALVGLQFVVMTLIADRPPDGVAEAGPVFSTPTIVHFGAVLFLSAMLHAPWFAMAVPAAIWGLLGWLGLIYMSRVIRRIRRQKAYKPEFEDWLFHALTPLAAYGVLAGSAFFAVRDAYSALFAVGGAALLLLFTGIHNAWDSIAYHVVVHRAAGRKEPSLHGD